MCWHQNGWDARRALEVAKLQTAPTNQTQTPSRGANMGRHGAVPWVSCVERITAGEILGDLTPPSSLPRIVSKAACDPRTALAARVGGVVLCSPSGWGSEQVGRTQAAATIGHLKRDQRRRPCGLGTPRSSITELCSLARANHSPLLSWARTCACRWILSNAKSPGMARSPGRRFSE